MSGCWENQRFFPEAADGVRTMLTDYLDDLRRSAQSLPDLEVLILGGGYGRGEGGLLTTEAGPALFNDLEFYLLLRRAGGGESAWIQKESAAGHARTGIEVEFKAMTLRSLAQARPSMFYYDLLSANVVVAGNGECLNGLPAVLREAGSLPEDEAARLLMNRGCSLLRCARMAAGEADAPEGFLERITAKAKLALGDAWLCARGQYHWSCLERHRRLIALTDLPPLLPLLAWHEEAVDFKFHPLLGSRPPESWGPDLTELRAAWRDVFLALESRRLGVRFACPADYAAWTKPVLTDVSIWAGGLRRARLAVQARRLPPRPWLRHPREAVLRALVLLIDPDRSPVGTAAAARLLGLPESAPPIEVEEACRALWLKVP